MNKIAYISPINNNKNCSSLFVPSAPVVYSGISNQTIQFLEFTSQATPNIRFSNCSNLTIKYIKVKNPIKDTSGSFVGRNVGIYLENCTNCTIQYCYGDNFVNFIYCINCTNINVLDNYGQRCYRIMPRGQFVQFNDVQVGAIQRNKFYNPRGFQNEDMINLFDTEDIDVSDNDLKGENNYSTSGTGAIVDGSALYLPTRNLIHNNRLRNTGQVGIGLAGGDVNECYENQIYGVQQTASNVGAYIGNFAGSPSCDRNELVNNEINWTNAAGLLNNTFIDTTPPNNATNSVVSGNVNTPSLAATLLVDFTMSEEIYESGIYATI
jgi:hypothetical protein